MNDTTTTLEELKEKMSSFVKEREWQEFHTPKNLSMALGKETGKLFGQFQWVDSQQSINKFEQNREAIEQDLGQLTAFLLSFCALYHVDLSRAFSKTLRRFEETYTPEKTKEVTRKIKEY